MGHGPLVHLAADCPGLILWILYSLQASDAKLSVPFLEILISLAGLFPRAWT